MMTMSSKRRSSQLSCLCLLLAAGTSIQAFISSKGYYSTPLQQRRRRQSCQESPSVSFFGTTGTTSSSSRPAASSFSFRSHTTAIRTTATRQAQPSSDQHHSSTSGDDDESSSEQIQSLHHLNVQLDRLAQTCAQQSTSNSQAILAASQCEDLFRQYYNQLKEEEDTTTAATTTTRVQASTSSFNIVLRAWSKTSGTLTEHRQQQTPTSSWTLPQGTVASSSSGSIGTIIPSAIPSVPVYTARDAMERATKLLLEMEQQSTSSSEHHDNETTSHHKILPDTTSYNMVMEGWAKSRLDEAPHDCELLLKRLLEHPRLHADASSYQAVLEAWALSKQEDAMDRVLKIYHKMVSLEQEGTTSVKPTSRTINVMVAAYARRVSACVQTKNYKQAMDYATAAHALLREAQERYDVTQDPDQEPDVMTYTSVMDAYARCGTMEATNCAEQLLEELKQRYAKTKNPRLQPNVRTYTSLITAFSKTRDRNSPRRAEELLVELQQLASKKNDGNEPIVKPNVRTYTTVIQCWARSRDPTKPQRALRLLKQMRELYQQGDKDAKPNLITYNAAIDACARCNGDTKQQTEALKIAFAILKTIEMDPGIEPNQVTFATLLKATAFLMPGGEERNKVASAVFEKARTAGMVELTMVQNLRKAVDNQVMRELLEELVDQKGSLDYNNIPPSWSRNVR